MVMTRGVGILDANYPTSRKAIVDGKKKQVWICPIYALWKGMIDRVYADLERKPCYKVVTICDEWHRFSEFEKWCRPRYKEGLVLDKDLKIIGNTVYSPETCLFIPPYVNNSIVNLHNDMGHLKGAHRLVDKSKRQKREKLWAARMSKNDGGTHHIACFATEMEAHRCWQEHKIKRLRVVALEQTDSQVREGLERLANYIQNDYDNNQPTLIKRNL